jgi:dTMP kinase
MEVDAAVRRIQRAQDRMESQGREFLRRVRQGYLDEAARHAGKIVVIDADRDAGTVQQDIREAARRLVALD